MGRCRSILHSALSWTGAGNSAPEWASAMQIACRLLGRLCRSFHLHMGFDPSPIDPDTLLIRLFDVAATLLF